LSPLRCTATWRKATPLGRRVRSPSAAKRSARSRPPGQRAAGPGRGEVDADGAGDPDLAMEILYCCGGGAAPAMAAARAPAAPAAWPLRRRLQPGTSLRWWRRRRLDAPAPRSSGAPSPEVKYASAGTSNNFNLTSLESILG